MIAIAYLGLWSNSAAKAANWAVGSGSPAFPKAAKKIAFTRKIFQGTLPTVKLRLLRSPMRSSLVVWLTFPKIWGRNAAKVSAFRLFDNLLATSRPSGNAINAPSTPSRDEVRDTISLGVAYFEMNLVPTEGL